MDIGAFNKWCSDKGVPEPAAKAVLDAVSGKSELESVVDTVVKDDGNFITLIASLGRPKGKDGKPLCNVQSIIAIYRQNSSPMGKPVQKPMTEAAGSKDEKGDGKGDKDKPEETSGKDKPAPQKSGFPGVGNLFGGGGKKPASSQRPGGIGPKVSRPSAKKSGKGALVIFVLIVVVLLALGAFLALGAGKSGGNAFVPGDPGTPTPQVDSNGNPVQWFTVKSDKLDTTQPFLVKPASFSDFIKNVPWRWLLWLLFFGPMIMLLAKDRFSSNERTDVGTVLLSLTILTACVVLADAVGWVIQYVSTALGYPMDAPVIWINILGIGLNLFGQWSASTSGKRDYSAFAIGGLFATGAILIWWNPTVTITCIIGAIFMAGGILLQGYEMRRSHQGGQAIFVSFVILLVFAITMVVWQVFCWGVSYVPQPTNELAAKLLGFLAWALVSSKAWMSGVIGILVAYGMGDMIASAIMPPRRPSPAVADNYPNRDDRERRQDVDSRYDAMVFGIMLLYPLALLVWQAIRIFGVM